MLNRRSAYLRSSSTWPINLCATEWIHKARRPCMYVGQLRNENMTHLTQVCSAADVKMSLVQDLRHKEQ